MFKLKLLAFILPVIPFLPASAQCPGNVASLHVRIIERSLVVVPVKINHSGPYDMLVDTGAQVTTIDPALSTELHLSAEGTAGVIGAGVFRQEALIRLDLLEAGSQFVKRTLALVGDLRQLQAADKNIRGILGSNFLGHFDMLLDYAHGALCLDDGKQLQQKVKGERIALIKGAKSDGDLPFTERCVIAVRVSGVRDRDLHLILDSGSNAPLVFDRTVLPVDLSSKNAVLTRVNGNGVAQRFAVLTAPDIQVGTHSFHRIPFVTPIDTGRDVPKLQEDGLLPTVLFQRIYISHSKAYAVIEPW
jgi:Aspartyl protease